jgi:Phospholipase_D-nuclease N-terminal/Short C-terminal domain
VTFWEVMWSFVVLFFWVMAFWIFLTCFMDVFRRDDLSGGMKAVWIVVLFIIPFIGCLIYLVSRPRVTMTDVKSMARDDAAYQAASGVSTADELTKLAQLRDSGAITVPEYDKLKAKLIA